MKIPTTSLFFLSLCCISSSFFPEHNPRFALAQNATTVDVGVVLDFNSLPGKRDWTSISMAMDDFYATRSNVTRRVILHRRDSQNDIVGAAAAALDLLKNVKTVVIIGPTTSSQTEFVVNLGNRSQVPIVAFSVTSPSLSSLQTPYFVRATLNDSSQVGAIAAFVKFHGWREVVPVYEDSDYGSGIVPFLIDEFNSIDTRVPYRSVVSINATDDWISAELYKLSSMQTRVFVVHMTSMLGSKFFPLARDAGLMNPGYVWIVTDSLTNVIDTLDPTVLDSMEGVLGVRSYMPKSNALASFSARWRVRFLREYLNETALVDPTAYQFWAYDAAWAVALAAEKAGKLNGGFNSPPGGVDNSTDLGRLGVSKSGQQFLQAILGVQFRGLSGDFRLVDGQLQSAVFEFVNVMGHSARVVGFWSPATNVVKDLRNTTDIGLKTVIWPGDSKVVPKGWEIPSSGKKLKIGVPLKNGFNEFVNIETNNVTGQLKVSGYCIDIFESVMSTLPYSVAYEYEAFDGTYDDLISQVYFQRYDAVVGDTTIIANRSLYVDFTLPYTESGVSMVVPVQEDKSKNAWIFLKPLTTDLWLASLAFFFFTGFVVWVIEHQINSEFRGPPSQQMGTIFYFAFSTLVFAHKEKLESNLSRFAVIIWVFVVLILTSSYTASLTSMLTVQQLQPSVTDLSELIKNGDYIGYQDGSFVVGMLTNMLKVNPNKLKNYSTTDEYAEALKLGSVAAIFDEIPYLKLFLSKHCQDFAMVGRIYKTGGFGFVFPRDSPLVPDVSRAVLSVIEGNTMSGIEQKWFGNLNDCSGDTSSLTSSSLDFRSFGGLFLITGCVSLLALILFLICFMYKEWGELKSNTSHSSLWRKFVGWFHHFDTKDLSSHTFRVYDASMIKDTSSHGNPSGEAEATRIICQCSQSPVSINLSELNFGLSDVGSRSFRERNEAAIEEPQAEIAIEIVGAREQLPAEIATEMVGVRNDNS